MKFDSISHKCAFLGYDVVHKYFLLYDLDSHKVFTFRDVKFFPKTYPFSDTVKGAQEVQLPMVDILGDEGITMSDDESSAVDGEAGNEAHLEHQLDEPQHTNTEMVPLRRSTRDHHPPEWMKDYVRHL